MEGPKVLLFLYFASSPPLPPEFILLCIKAVNLEGLKEDQRVRFFLREYLVLKDLFRFALEVRKDSIAEFQNVGNSVMV